MAKTKDNSARIYIRPGTATSEAISGVMDSLSDLYRAMGGSGIVFEVVEESKYTWKDRHAAQQGYIPVIMKPAGLEKKARQK